MPRVMMFEMPQLDLLCKMKCFFLQILHYLEHRFWPNAIHVNLSDLIKFNISATR